MIVNHNISALFTHRVNKFNQWELSKTTEKISSGERINRAGDDAAGLAVSEKMRAQIRGLKQASRNSEDGITFIQTAEGFLQNISDMLQRMRELAIQSSNGIYSSEDRMQIQVEVSELIDEIDRIASQSQYNGLTLLTGRFAKPVGANLPVASMWLHIGANMDQRERLYLGTMNTQGLGLKNPVGPAEIATFISLSSPNKANSVIGTIDSALSKLNKQRANLGAYQNRLEFATKGILVGYENLQSAESRIRDTDMAAQSIKLMKHNILNQSSLAMLAQANTRPQAVLQLLQ